MGYRALFALEYEFLLVRYVCDQNICDFHCYVVTSLFPFLSFPQFRFASQFHLFGTHMFTDCGFLLFVDKEDP